MNTAVLNLNSPSAALSPGQNTLALIGRVLLAWLFVPAGWSKLMAFSGVAGYIASKGVPFPEVCAAIAIAAELGLGLMLLVGWRARWAALGLAIFVAVITPIFHNYWALPEAQVMMQKQAFNKNLAVVGGLLVLTAFGAGAFSLDGRRNKA
ncbi:DoxX family protein [Ramlibacter albus]|uniref:DoxX family protein n=1 Tax=Ramlibacter albus TaxID=2079448 RepID=A0A923S415_9BURK|nr:DoxX family protein [Ramlibacter albus]MBC5766433.1 DoxX family protein [Ramlibacter albus]